MTTLPLADARANLSKLIEDASTTHERIEITKNGRRAAVLLGADDYDALHETIAVLSDPDLLRVMGSVSVRSMKERHSAQKSC